jgi:hypothetical protein
MHTGRESQSTGGSESCGCHEHSSFVVKVSASAASDYGTAWRPESMRKCPTIVTGFVESVEAFANVW